MAQVSVDRCWRLQAKTSNLDFSHSLIPLYLSLDSWSCFNEEVFLYHNLKKTITLISVYLFPSFNYPCNLRNFISFSHGASFKLNLIPVFGILIGITACDEQINKIYRLTRDINIKILLLTKKHSQIDEDMSLIFGKADLTYSTWNIKWNRQCYRNAM